MKKRIIGVIIALVLSNLFLLAQYFDGQKEKVYALLGTYSNQTDYPIYKYNFVFDSDNNYYLYEVNTLIDQGTWQKQENNVYIIKSDKADNMIITDKIGFYYFDLEIKNEVIQFEKISSVPIFFNTNEE